MNDSSEYRPVLTEDGSYTLFVQEYDQTMHTITGAYTESVIKHLHPSGVLEKKHGIRVLDVGFGLGYNLLALIHEARKKGFGFSIEAVSLENDRSLGRYIAENTFPDEREQDYDLIRKAFFSGHVHTDQADVTVLFGDGRASIKSLAGQKFDCVFQDPFSPSKNPELWTVEYFMLIKNLMADEGILTTYSSAAQVRAAMEEAGFFLGKGPSMGPKKEGTLAAMQKGFFDGFSPEEIRTRLLDKNYVPYRDPDLKGSRNEIISRRKEEKHQRKLKNNIINLLKD